MYSFSSIYVYMCCNLFYIHVSIHRHTHYFVGFCWSFIFVLMLCKCCRFIKKYFIKPFSLFLSFSISAPPPLSLSLHNITHKASYNVQMQQQYTKKVWTMKKICNNNKHDTIRYVHDHADDDDYDDDGNGCCFFFLLNTEFNEFCYVNSITKWLVCVCLCVYAVVLYSKL